MNRNKTDITPDTKVGELLDDYPELESLLRRFSPAFSALKNPVLRKTVARVTSLQQAAKVGNADVVEMVNALRKEAGLVALEDRFCSDDTGVEVPVADKAPDTRVTHTLDVRPLIQAGEHPKEAVLSLADRLQKGECLLFIAPFPPLPLIDLLKKKGFTVTMLAPHNGAVHTFVERR